VCVYCGHCHRTRFRDSFCLASVFEMTVYLLTYLLTYLQTLSIIWYRHDTIFGHYLRHKIAKGTSSAGALNTQGWENFATIDRKRRLSRKRDEICPRLLGSLIGSHMWPSIRVDSNDLE